MVLKITWDAEAIRVHIVLNQHQLNLLGILMFRHFMVDRVISIIIILGVAPDDDNIYLYVQYYIITGSKIRFTPVLLLLEPYIQAKIYKQVSYQNRN